VICFVISVSEVAAVYRLLFTTASKLVVNSRFVAFSFNISRRN